jgi:Rrf2 family protein
MRLELTRRADYAVRAMLALARTEVEREAARPNGAADAARPSRALMSGPAIAAATGSPRRFVTQVMGDLVTAGLVEARTGRLGGYRLRRPPSAISILDVVEAIEGDARRRTCVLRGSPCARDGECDVHAIFSAAQDALLERLGSASLSAALAGGPKY